MQVNIAVNDFSPALLGLDSLLRELKRAGADGIELGIGVKSRWTPDHCIALSRKYDLPIVSAHQPMWSVMGVMFDEGAFATAQKLGVSTVTCHPLPKLELSDPKMKLYFEKLAEIKQKTGLEILVENLPQKYNHPLLNAFFPPSHKSTGIIDLYEAVNEFDLNLTLDTDHLQSVAPHEESYFETILPRIKSIHLSSFEQGRHHLPLFLGDMKVKAFTDHLKQIKFDGIVTLEINYPGITLFNYNFDAIKRSIELIKD